MHKRLAEAVSDYNAVAPKRSMEGERWLVGGWGSWRLSWPCLALPLRACTPVQDGWPGPDPPHTRVPYPPGAAHVVWKMAMAHNEQTNEGTALIKTEDTLRAVFNQVGTRAT